MKKTLKKAGALLVATGLVVSSAMPVMAKGEEEEITLTISL